MSKLDDLIQKLCPDGVEYKPLSEIFNTRNGYTPSKKEKNFWENGTVPWFRMEDIRENGGILDHAMQYVSINAIKGDPFPENSIIVATSATIGEHALITVPSIANQRFTYLMVKEQYKDDYDPKFLYYYCFKLDEYCKECLNQGNFASVDMKKFAKFQFPRLPIEIQREIVRMLDSYTESVVELQRQLTAELIARKTQYAYYRDSLLSMKSQWYHVKIIDMLSQPITDGPHTTPQFVQNGVPFVSVDSIWDGKIHFEKMRGYITEAFDEECCKKYKPQKNDVYMVKSGSTTGKVAFVDTDIRFNIWSPLAAMRVNEQNSARFLFYLLQTEKVQKQVKAKASHGSQPNLGMRELEQFEVDVPQDRQSSFEPQVLPKRQKDISSIDDKIIAMYAKGMTTRQISETIEDIYGFEVSEGMISDITDKLLPRIEEWQNRPLSPVYPIVFIDAVHFSVRDDGVIRKLAAYVVLGINEDGKKEVLSIVVGENESSKYWLSVLNSLKNRGVQDILILCSDGLTGIKDAISTAFPKTEQQRCIVHMVRNTLKYVANKDMKTFAKDLKTIYTAASEETARKQLETVI